MSVQIDNEKARRDRENRLTGSRIDLSNICNSTRGSSRTGRISSPTTAGSTTQLDSHGNSVSSSPKENNNLTPSDNENKLLQAPMTPMEAITHYGSRLTEYEKQEIEKYPEIWYLGLGACKINARPGSVLNSGYDDDNGNYNQIIHDHICYRYEILNEIGKGSFGQVIKAYDHKTDRHVAIKLIRNKKRFHHQALVEVRILDQIRKKYSAACTIHMHDYFYFRNHLCICFELLCINLYELIKKNNFQGLSLSLIRRFTIQIIKCLGLLYEENIIHCDLKPENILLRQRGGSNIKVIDFGSSCYSHHKVYTYIQSRFYRSPEVILGLSYGTPIDMWSLGCILAELYTGYPLFPGENEVEQLACIMEIIGLPPEDIINSATRKRLFFDSRGSPRCITNSKGRKRKPGSKSLATALRCNDVLFIDFLSKCLEWDPQKRMTPEEANRHEFLQTSSRSKYKHLEAMREREKFEQESTATIFSQKQPKSKPVTPSKVLPDIKKSSSRDRCKALTASVTDLDQQISSASSVHRLNNTRKITSSSKLGSQHQNHGMMHSQSTGNMATSASIFGRA